MLKPVPWLVVSCFLFAGCSGGATSTDPAEDGQASADVETGPAEAGFGGGGGFGGPGGGGFGGGPGGGGFGGPGGGGGGPGGGGFGGGPGRGGFGGGPGGGGRSSEPVEPTPVAVESGEVTLNQDNTMVKFVGEHAKEDPNPRTGVFTQLSGKAKVDPEAKTLQAVEVEIDAESVTTRIPPLTSHLQNEDFLDHRNHPKITFKSTKIELLDSEAGKHQVTGDLTLLNTTKEVQFPVEVTFSDEGVTLTGDLEIDRTEFGMDKLQDRVAKKVALSFAIGRKSELPAAGGGRGFGGGRGRGGGGGGGFDPEAIFKQRDTDGDGFLAGDEISDRFREAMDEADKDKDGKVSLEEFKAQIAAMFSGGRGGGGRGGRGGGGFGGRGGGGGFGGRGGGGGFGGRGGGSGRPQRPPLDDGSADGKAADGKAADGKAADGKAASGQAADGKAADGKAADGKAADGKAASGQSNP